MENQPVQLFDIASRHLTWLAERQQVTAANIANANTPAYRAREVEPFSRYLEGPAVSLATTSPGHMTLPEGEARAAATQAGSGWGSGHSGNNVSIEKELMTASSSSRMLSLDTSILRSFHRMILASVKV
jgi:flagellar basal-body rod protein FlgB